MVRSAYIHIPFCRSKCNYCSFVSYPKLELKKEYLKILAKEINNYYEEEMLNTIYFGGGTPSLLEISELENILRIFKFSSNTEITLEANPDDCSYDYFRGLYDLGINRISLGCQTFSESILKLINRRHNAGQVIDAVKTAQDAGFKNISLDLIYGLPNQTIEIFNSDIQKAISLGIQHISFYGLKIEPGCYFYNNMPENLPDDDMQADMYISGVKLLEDNGFEHYEVSNFAKHGYNSRHNSAYWQNEEYYGFGVAAHGYKNGIRYANKDTIESYLEDCFSHKETKIISPQAKLEEEIFLGFRMMKGINVSNINAKYGIDFEEKYRDVLQKYEKLNLLKKTKDGYAFTLQGILVSNVILADFIE